MAPQADIEIPSFFSFTKTWHNASYDAISPSRPELSVTGKTVVITGGGTGIGKAIANAFVQAGASCVAILGRREDRLKAAVSEITNSNNGKKHPSKLLYEVVDLTKRDMVKRAMNSIVSKHGGSGKIDIFVSNAGAAPPAGPAVDYDEEEFMGAFEVNVRTTLNAVHAFVPLAAENATLLNISSGVMHMLPIPGISAYAASKAAGTKLIDFVQVENPHLHVVNVQPGVVDSEATRKSNVEAQDDADLPGNFCVWLASPEAEFLKGKYVWANWDVEELKSRATEIQSSRLLSIMLEGVPM